MRNNLREKWTLFTYGAVIARWQCLFCLLSMAKKQYAIWFDLIVRCQLFAHGWIFKTSLYVTRRCSCFVYVLNIYFLYKSLYWAQVGNLLYILPQRGQYWTRYEWTAPLSVCRSVVFQRTSLAVENVFCLCRARSHTRARIHAQRSQRAKEVKRIRRSSSIGVARISSLGLLLHTATSPMRFPHRDATPQLLGIYSAVTFAIAVDSNQSARTSA